MHELYKLRDDLCDELKGYAEKGVSAGSLGTVDTLAHTIKNLDKIIDASDEEYSSRSYPDGMGGSYRRSYARRRDGMGRYSRADFADKLHEMMQDAPNDQIRREMQKLAEKL